MSLINHVGCKFFVPTDVDEFDAVVGDGVEGDGDVLQLVVLVLRTLVVPDGDGTTILVFGLNLTRGKYSYSCTGISAYKADILDH